MARRKTSNPKAPNTVHLPATGNETYEQALAKIAAAGLLDNAATMQRFGQATYGAIDIAEAFAALTMQGKAANRGDLSGAEAMLAAQASALNTIFAEMARRAAINLGEYLGATETYLRLALKAQTQCRATLETLATIKAGPTVIARQANIAHGPQQVNNGNRDAFTRESETQSAKTELLGVSDGERLDTGTTGATGRSDPALEALGTIDGAENGGRQGPGKPER